MLYLWEQTKEQKNHDEEDIGFGLPVDADDADASGQTQR
jgi:hypothetical protein